MLARSLRVAAALTILVILASCSAIQSRSIKRPLLYNVRDVTVVANAEIPLSVISGVDRRVRAAMTSTRPAPGVERVVLLVKIDKVDEGEGARRGLGRAHFTVTATSVETGNPVAEGRFVANSAISTPKFKDEALAEEIAARIRFAFSLSTPRLRKAAIPPRSISTRLKGEAGDVQAPTAIAPSEVKPDRDVAPASQSANTNPPPAPKPLPQPLAPGASGKVEFPPQPPRPAAETKPGTSVEEGASGKIRLDGECDPRLVADCLAPKQ